jgi:hypothetical protein
MLGPIDSRRATLSPLSVTTLLRFFDSDALTDGERIASIEYLKTLEVP